MRVIHIIPSAFEYFDDIRSKAFNLVDGLNQIGVETEAFTLQYGSVGKSVKQQVRSDSPSVHSYINTTSTGGLVSSLGNFDLVHLHCPFLGAARQILDWKKLNPDFPLVITYYRDVPFSDIFSLFIKLYNAYFLPKIFIAADKIISQNPDTFRAYAGARFMPEGKEIIFTDTIQLRKEWGKFEGNEAVAAKAFLVYNSLTHFKG